MDGTQYHLSETGYNGVSLEMADEGYSRSSVNKDVYALRQEFNEFRKRRDDEATAYRAESNEWRKQHKEDLFQFRGEVTELRKAIDILTRMMGQVEQQTISTKDMTIREQKQMEQVYFLLRGDNEGRGGILGRIAALEYQTKELQSRREETMRELHNQIEDLHKRRAEVVKSMYERLDSLEQNRDKNTARIWQLVITLLSGSVMAFALGRLIGP